MTGPAAPPPLVGVRFRRAGKIYYFDASGHAGLAVGDHVIVDTVRGRESGEVVIAPGQVVDTTVANLKPIERQATWEELADLARHRLDEPRVLERVQAEIAAHDLPMKAVLAEYNFDGSRLTIYFVSDEHRVDFRDLVRDLAQALRTRVHLRQVGARDKAKLLGGVDRCGRELCCSTWLPEFQPISIRMAKTQGLPLSPPEISGICGKLLCCLAFEDELYAEMRHGLPKLGARLTSAVGGGRVVDVNILARTITVLWETGARVEIDAEAFAEQQARVKRATSGSAAPPGQPTSG